MADKSEVAIKKLELLISPRKKKFLKKKGCPNSNRILIRWSIISFCGMNAEESWAGTSMWRRNGVVGDFPFSIFQMVSTISSINSDPELQLQGYPQNYLFSKLKLLINWSYNQEEISYEKLNEMPKIWLDNWFLCQWTDCFKVTTTYTTKYIGF